MEQAAGNADQAAASVQTVPGGEWKVTLHPFGGGYAVSRKVEGGRREHLYSGIGAAPQIRSFPLRGDAQIAAGELNGGAA
jgi:hypothetical protein